MNRQQLHLIGNGFDKVSLRGLLRLAYVIRGKLLATTTSSNTSFQLTKAKQIKGIYANLLKLRPSQFLGLHWETEAV